MSHPSLTTGEALDHYYTNDLVDEWMERIPHIWTILIKSNKSKIHNYCLKFKYYLVAYVCHEIAKIHNYCLKFKYYLVAYVCHEIAIAICFY